jgi:putative ABC transport system permease protein
MAASWIAALSLMSLLLAAIGLYGAIAQSVAQRTREAGIRIALGAAPGSIARLVMKEGIVLAAIGLALGLPVALGFSTLMRRFVAGVSGADPTSLTLVAMLLALVMLAACWAPARRAAKVDPIAALRHE